MSKQAMNPSIKLDEQSTVGYESADEIDASKYQVAWANVMEEGRYLSLSVYERGEVLILCWKEHCSDVDTRTEVEHLVNVLEVGFGYWVHHRPSGRKFREAPPGTAQCKSRRLRRHP